MPHWLPAYLNPPPPPTFLSPCLPGPPPAGALVRSGRRRTMAPLWRWPLACLKARPPASSIPLSPSGLSLCPPCAMGKPRKSGFFCTCVSDQRTEGGGLGGLEGGGRLLSLVFGLRLPTVPLLLLLHPSFVPPSSSSFCPRGDSLIRRFCPPSLLLLLLLLSLINALGWVFLFVST